VRDKLHAFAPLLKAPTMRHILAAIAIAEMQRVRNMTIFAPAAVAGHYSLCEYCNKKTT